jgi:tight adherence protein B
MTSAGIALALIAAFAIMLIAYALSSAAGSSGVSARLERYASTGRRKEDEKATDGPAPSIADMLSQSEALSQFSKVVDRQSFAQNTATDLARADLKLRVSEYLMVIVGSTIGVPVLLMLLSAFYPALGNPIFLIIGAIVGFMLPRIYVGRRQKSRLNAFNKQLPDTITLIANALRSGSSFLQAIELVTREARPPISLEFARVIREVNLGLAFDQSLENLVRRVRSEDLELLVTAITIQHQVGGNLAEILDSIAYTIRERIRIKGEIRTLTAQQRISGYVVAALPIGMVGLIFVIAPTFMEPMFQKPPEGPLGLPLGVFILGIGAFSMFIGFLLIRRIVDIEV